MTRVPAARTIEQVPLGQLVDAEIAMIPVRQCVMLRRNPQYLTPAEMEALKLSIQRDGFLVPILVRPVGDGYEVVSGNHRLMAAQELGLPEVPAVVRALSDRDASRLAVNLNTIHGDPTPELLAPFLADLDDDLLREVHLESEMLDGLLAFDDVLATRLRTLEVPEVVDQPADSAPVPTTCRCPVCGRGHARGKAPVE